MGFRSRALLTGVATGFLKANNDRRERMAERLQQLSDNRALMDRERAKSEYMAHTKAAAEEKAKWQSLRSVDHIDDNGEYTQKYYDTVAYNEFQKNEVREAYGNDFNKFAAEYAKINKQNRFVRQYKDPEEMSNGLTRLYDSIDARQRSELNMPVLTDFDSLLGTGLNVVKKAFGGTTEPMAPFDGTLPNAPIESLNPFKEQEMQPTSPQEYTPLNFKTPQEADAIKDVKTVEDSAGNVHVINVYESGKVATVDTDINKGKATSLVQTSYDEDGTEYIVTKYKDGTSDKVATGLTKKEKAGNLELSVKDLKDPVDKLTMERIRDGSEATRLVGNIMRDTTVETSAVAPKLINSIVLNVQEELIGTFGSAEEKAKATNMAMNAAFAGDLAFIDARSEADKQMGTTVRNQLAARISGLKQDRLALAYALVRLNRASGRFNGQELQEQIELLSSGSLAQATSVLKRAQDQVEQSLEFDVQQAAASVVATSLIGEGNTTLTKNEVLGWAAKKPVRDPKNGSYYVMFNAGPYKYAYVKPNGGVVLRKRQE